MRTLSKNSGTSKRGPAVSYGEKGWRFVRLWQTLLIVVEAERPLGVQEVNARLGLVPELREFEGKVATTRDDLWVLVRCGFPLRVCGEQGEEIDLAEYLDDETPRRGKLKNVRWSLRPGSDIGRLEDKRHRRPTPAELTSLSLLRALLRDDVPPGYPLYQQLRVLLESLQLWLMGHVPGADRSQMVARFLASGKRNVGSIPKAELLTVVAQGLQSRRMLEGTYTMSPTKDVLMQALPLAAWFRDGRGFVLGARGHDGALRTYRLDRFVTLSVRLDLRPPPVDEAAVDRLLGGRFGGYIGEPQRVRLHAAATVSYLFDEYQFHPSQAIRRRRDGSLTVTLDCAVSMALEEWILGFGERVEVLEPASLRESISNRLVAAAVLYRSTGSRADENHKGEGK